jgi:hypothetical protein
MEKWRQVLASQHRATPKTPTIYWVQDVLAPTGMLETSLGRMVMWPTARVCQHLAVLRTRMDWLDLNVLVQTALWEKLFGKGKSLKALVRQLLATQRIPTPCQGHLALVPMDSVEKSDGRKVSPEALANQPSAMWRIRTTYQEQIAHAQMASLAIYLGKVLWQKAYAHQHRAML